MKRETLEQLLDIRAAGRPVVLVTAVDDGDQEILEPGLDGARAGFGAEVLDAARAVLREDRSRIVEVDGRRLFVQAFNPPLRMLIIGAVHITQALAPMAAMAGYAVMVIDPRRAFATAERFTGIEFTTEWPDDALSRLSPDARSAVVTLTHDPKIDDPALTVALRSPAFYIGSLGSRRTHAARVARLAEAGFDAGACERIHAPVGLDIGAKSPAEIAVAVLAEVTAALRRPAPA